MNADSGLQRGWNFLNEILVNRPDWDRWAPRIVMTLGNYSEMQFCGLGDLVTTPYLRAGWMIVHIC